MMGTFLEADDGERMLCTGPDWLDHEVAETWNSAGLDGAVKPGAAFDRTVLYRYSARQMRDHEIESDTFWAEDGELQSFVVSATPKRPARAPIDQSKDCGVCGGVGHLGPATRSPQSEYGKACPNCQTFEVES